MTNPERTGLVWFARTSWDYLGCARRGAWGRRVLFVIGFPHAYRHWRRLERAARHRLSWANVTAGTLPPRLPGDPT